LYANVCKNEVGKATASAAKNYQLKIFVDERRGIG
jgi:hypothetical protein